MNALTLTPVDGEPRIFDLTLAERLGFEQPRDIRNAGPELDRHRKECSAAYIFFCVCRF
jgi:hypothetical protein